MLSHAFPGNKGIFNFVIAKVVEHRSEWANDINPSQYKTLAFEVLAKLARPGFEQSVYA